MRYKIVQTGAKTQSGGFKPDLISVEYQGSFKLIDTAPPMNEAEKVIIKKRMLLREKFYIQIIIE